MDWKQVQAYHALQEVARREGIPVTNIIQSIEDVIQEAYSTALKEDSQETLAAWHRIPRKGAIPDALELIAYLADRLAEETAPQNDQNIIVSR